jgi:hypothetical protein
MTSIDPKRQQYASIVSANSHIPKDSPHLRLTFDQVRDRKDAMRCDQYLIDILASMKAIGWKFVIHDIPKFAEKIGLSMRTFQRARKLLITTGKLIENRINRDAFEFFLVGDDDTTIAQDDQPIAVNDTPIAVNDTPIAVTPLKAPLPTEYRDPSDLLSDQYTDPLSLPTPGHERENLELFENGKPIAAFKEWLGEQAKKMPRAIGNIPVWIASMSRREAWQEAFIEWRERSVEFELSAVPVPLSPSTDCYFQDFRSTETDQDIEERKAAIARAKKLLVGVAA